MDIVEIKCNADLRVVTMGLAQKVGVTRLCAIVTDDVAFARLGERLSNRVFRCDEIYVAIVPELFSVTDNKTLHEIVDASINEVFEVTGEKCETCLLCWTNEMETDYENKVAVSIFRTGMSTVERAGYAWDEASEENKDSTTIRYVIFYDKKKYKQVMYEKTEKVLVTDAELKSIREMEQTGKFKHLPGGFNSIANDIAVKKCKVYGDK